MARRIDAIEIGIGADISGLQRALETASSKVRTYNFPDREVKVSVKAKVDGNALRAAIRHVQSTVQNKADQEITFKAHIIPVRASIREMIGIAQGIVDEKNKAITLRVAADVASAKTIHDDIQNRISGMAPVKIPVVWGDPGPFPGSGGGTGGGTGGGGGGGGGTGGGGTTRRPRSPRGGPSASSAATPPPTGGVAGGPVTRPPRAPRRPAATPPPTVDEESEAAFAAAGVTEPPVVLATPPSTTGRTRTRRATATPEPTTPPTRTRARRAATPPPSTTETPPAAGAPVATPRRGSRSRPPVIAATPPQVVPEEPPELDIDAMLRSIGVEPGTEADAEFDLGYIADAADSALADTSWDAYIAKERQNLQRKGAIFKLQGGRFVLDPKPKRGSHFARNPSEFATLMGHYKSMVAKEAAGGRVSTEIPGVVTPRGRKERGFRMPGFSGGAFRMAGRSVGRDRRGVSPEQVALNQLVGADNEQAYIKEIERQAKEYAKSHSADQMKFDVDADLLKAPTDLVGYFEKKVTSGQSLSAEDAQIIQELMYGNPERIPHFEEMTELGPVMRPLAWGTSPNGQPVAGQSLMGQLAVMRMREPRRFVAAMSDKFSGTELNAGYLGRARGVFGLTRRVTDLLKVDADQSTRAAEKANNRKLSAEATRLYRMTPEQRLSYARTRFEDPRFTDDEFYLNRANTFMRTHLPKKSLSEFLTKNPNVPKAELGGFVNYGLGGGSEGPLPWKSQKRKWGNVRRHWPRAKMRPVHYEIVGNGMGNYQNALPVHQIRMNLMNNRDDAEATYDNILDMPSRPFGLNASDQARTFGMNARDNAPEGMLRYWNNVSNMHLDRQSYENTNQLYPPDEPLSLEDAFGELGGWRENPIDLMFDSERIDANLSRKLSAFNAPKRERGIFRKAKARLALSNSERMMPLKAVDPAPEQAASAPGAFHDVPWGDFSETDPKLLLQLNKFQKNQLGGDVGYRKGGKVNRNRRAKDYAAAENASDYYIRRAYGIRKTPETRFEVYKGIDSLATHKDATLPGPISFLGDDSHIGEFAQHILEHNASDIAQRFEDETDYSLLDILPPGKLFDHRNRSRVSLTSTRNLNRALSDFNRPTPNRIPHEPGSLTKARSRYALNGDQMRMMEGSYYFDLVSPEATVNPESEFNYLIDSFGGQSSLRHYGLFNNDDEWRHGVMDKLPGKRWMNNQLGGRIARRLLGGIENTPDFEWSDPPAEYRSSAWHKEILDFGKWHSDLRESFDAKFQRPTSWSTPEEQGYFDEWMDTSNWISRKYIDTLKRRHLSSREEYLAKIGWDPEKKLGPQPDGTWKWKNQRPDAYTPEWYAEHDSYRDWVTAKQTQFNKDGKYDEGMRWAKDAYDAQSSLHRDDLNNWSEKRRQEREKYQSRKSREHYRQSNGNGSNRNYGSGGYGSFRSGPTDTRSKIDKLKAMADQSVSPNEAEIARRILREKGIPGYMLGGSLGRVRHAMFGDEFLHRQFPNADIFGLNYMTKEQLSGLEEASEYFASQNPLSASLLRKIGPMDIASQLAEPGTFAYVDGLPFFSKPGPSLEMRWNTKRLTEDAILANENKGMFGSAQPGKAISRVFAHELEHVKDKVMLNALSTTNKDSIHFSKYGRKNKRENWAEQSATAGPFGDVTATMIRFPLSLTPEELFDGSFSNYHDKWLAQLEHVKTLNDAISLVEKEKSVDHYKRLSDAGYRYGGQIRRMSGGKTDTQSGPARVPVDIAGNPFSWQQRFDMKSMEDKRSDDPSYPLWSSLDISKNGNRFFEPNRTRSEAFEDMLSDLYSLGGDPNRRVEPHQLGGNIGRRQLGGGVERIGVGGQHLWMAPGPGWIIPHHMTDRVPLDSQSIATGQRAMWQGGKDDRPPNGLYLVGEAGDELFVPEHLGGLIPPDVMDQLPKRQGGGDVPKRAGGGGRGRRTAAGGGGPLPVLVMNWPASLTGGGGEAGAGAPFETPTGRRGRRSAPRAGEGPSVGDAVRDARGGPASTRSGSRRASTSARTEVRRAEMLATMAARREETGQEVASLQARAREATTRAPGVSVGQFFAERFGGRAQYIQRIQTAERAQREVARTQGIIENLTGKRQGVLERLQEARRMPEGPGKTEALRNASSDYQDLRKAMRTANETLGAQKQRAKDARAEIGGLGTVTRILGTNFGGVAVGMMAFNAQMAAINAGMTVLGEVAGPMVERMTGWWTTTNKVTGALSEQERQMRGNTKAVIAAASAQVGFSDSMTEMFGSVMSSRIENEAGSKAIAEQFDMIRTMQSVASGNTGFLQPSGGIPGLTRSTGGILGSPLNANPAMFEMLANEANGGLNPDIFGATNNLGRKMTRINTFGLRVDPNKAEQEASRFGDYVKALNGNADKAGTAFRLVNVAGEQNATALLDASAKSMRAAGMSERQIASIQNVGYAFVDVSDKMKKFGEATENAVANFGAAASKGATMMTSTQAISQNQRERRSQSAAIELQNAFAKEQVNPVQRYLKYAEQPPQPFGASFVTAPRGIGDKNAPPSSIGGYSTVDTDAQSAFDKYARTATKALDSVRAKALQGKAALKDIVDPTTIAAFENLGQQSQKMQFDVMQRRAALSAAQYNRQLFVTKRNLADAAALAGKVGVAEARRAKTNNGLLGYYQKQTWELGRQSQKLSLQMQQREITTQLALAQFQAPGDTGEERYYKQVEAVKRAKIADQQLNISKEQYKVSGLEFTETSLRGLEDAKWVLDELQTSHKLEVDTSALSDALQQMKDLQTSLSADLSTDMEKWSSVESAKISEIASIAANSDEAMNSIIKNVEKAWDDFFKYTVTKIGSLTGTNFNTDAYNPLRQKTKANDRTKDDTYTGLKIPTRGSNERKDKFADELAKRTGLSWNAARAWTQAEVGDSNNLGIMTNVMGQRVPKRFATPEEGAKAAADLINSSPLYAGIRASVGKSDENQLRAIASSPWHLGPTGLAKAGGVDSYYSRIFGLNQSGARAAQSVTSPSTMSPVASSFNITLNYNGSGSKADAQDMVAIVAAAVQRELARLGQLYGLRGAAN